jgi:hypothetical protein
MWIYQEKPRDPHIDFFMVFMVKVTWLRRGGIMDTADRNIWVVAGQL